MFRFMHTKPIIKNETVKVSAIATTHVFCMNEIPKKAQSQQPRAFGIIFIPYIYQQIHQNLNLSPNANRTRAENTISIGRKRKAIS